MSKEVEVKKELTENGEETKILYVEEKPEKGLKKFGRKVWNGTKHVASELWHHPIATIGGIAIGAAAVVAAGSAYSRKHEEAETESGDFYYVDIDVTDTDSETDETDTTADDYPVE